MRLLHSFRWDRGKDLLQLFAGGMVQWFLSALFARYATARIPSQVFVVTFIGQSLWWSNIQHTTKKNGRLRWFAWVSGAASGAALGSWL